MEKWIDISGISIPSDENDYYELVAFADAIAELEPIYMESVQAEAYNRGIDSERKRIADAWCKAEYERGYKEGRESAERKGEWVDAEIPLESGDTMPIQVCNLCKTFYPLAYTGGGHRFCPNCGAKMKGVDDE